MVGGADGTSSDLLASAISYTIAEMAKYILSSNIVRDAITDEFGLAERYGLWKTPRTSARNLVGSKLGFDYASGPRALSVRFSDT